MADNNIRNKQYDELKCIWMSSNLVDYKLCDRDFDCELCEFDKVMRNQAAMKQSNDEKNSPAANFFTKLIEKLRKDVKFRRPPYYHLKNNLIVKNLFGNIYYIGINPAVLLMLDCLNSVRFLTNGDKYVRSGVPLVNIEGDWGSVEILSPIDFLWLNKSGCDPIEFLTNDWFGLIEANKDEILGVSVDENEYNDNISKLNSKLNKYVTAYPETGVTMMDGGKNVGHLYEAIGSANYVGLLKELFSL